VTHVKICGLTNLADARVAVEAGADLLGFIFYEPSPRYVSPEQVCQIVAGLRQQFDRLPRLVGVFVNTPRPQVADILARCSLNGAQLHGDEPPEMVVYFAGRAYKALRPPVPDEAETLVAPYTTFSPGPELPQLLLDAYHPTLYGGTGQVTDWGMAARLARQHSIMLAGSLTPANVAEAVRTVRPWGVDVSSGVEAEKGRKDHQQVRAFVRAVKS
jgi:phosphoribosylanthranilate isomerase